VETPGALVEARPDIEPMSMLSKPSWEFATAQREIVMGFQKIESQ
jgi:hypothetical protein